MEAVGINLEMVLTIMGAIGLFLYGMFKMGEGLQNSAGDKVRRILEALTGNRLLAVLVGIVVTAVIQASGATTVMVVGFVNAGLMTLEQAIGVIMGSNIGTTITAQMVAFKLEKCALPAIALGMIIRFAVRRKKSKAFSDFLLGFGMLFLGISILGTALEGLRTYPPFMKLMLASGDSPILGVIVGALFTTAIQSSSATTSLLVTMASKNLIGLGGAIPMIFGANIGTTSTALIASVGASLTARRAALAHFIFNVGGTLLCLPFLGVFERLAIASSSTVARQIANAHTIFNVSVTLILLPFVTQFAGLVCKVLKGEDSIIEHGPRYLDPRFISTPFSAVAQLRKEVARMAKLSHQNLVSALEIFTGDSNPDRRRFRDIEEVIDELEEAISYYVARISQRSVTDDQARILTAMINVATDLERIGDHATAIVELADYKDEQNLPFSEEATQELRNMIKLVVDLVAYMTECLETYDKEKAASIRGMDDIIDGLEKDLRAQHIRRLNQGVCYPASGIVYLELLTHLERVGDHAVNIAEAITG